MKDSTRKFIKLMAGIIVGRLIHEVIKALTTLPNDNSDQSFLIRAFVAGGSILIGVAFVYGLAAIFFRKPGVEIDRSIPSDNGLHSLPERPPDAETVAVSPPSTVAAPRQRHGIQTGLLIIVFIASAIAASVLVKGLFSSRVSGAEILAKTSKELNANLPMQIDRDTRLDSTIAGPGNRFTYLYTLINTRSTEVDRGTFVSAMRPMIINGYREYPAMADFRRLNVVLHYQYRDQDGRHIAEITVSPKDF